ncbi:MAG: hypothetical protein K6G90_14235 [Clostridia bacterium]|nr:hypothetical protein [Clostridia bacterium]
MNISGSLTTAADSATRTMLPLRKVPASAKKRFIKIFSPLICAAALLGPLSAGFTAFAVIGVDTQYSYDSNDPGWLSDIIVKEDMATVESLAARSTLEPVTDYPYEHTAESFKSEIEYYEKLYTLDPALSNSAYLYIMQAASQMNGAAASDSYSDEYIKSYLTRMGIVWPQGGDETEHAIAARALFSFLTANPQYTVTPGAGLYDVFTTYLSQMVGTDVSSILAYDADATLSNIEEYVLAASKYTLFRKGYDVTASTGADETYRLMSVMTIREQSITVDAANATTDEIKNKYLCAMMSMIYDIEPDSQSFGKAASDGSLVSFILQCIGKIKGLAVKNGTSYQSAFETVRDNSDYFDLAKQFYADITEYNVSLKNRRSKIYLSLVPFISNEQDNALILRVNGEQVKPGYYSSVALDKTKAQEQIKIDVSGISDGLNFAKTYILNIRQGLVDPENTGTTVSAALSKISAAVEKAVSDIGVDTPFSGIMSQLPFSISNRVLSISSLLFPSSDGVDFGSFVQQVFGYAKTGVSSLSGLATTSIGGIGGLDAFLAAFTGGDSAGGSGNSGGSATVSTPLSVSFAKTAENNGADINNLQVIAAPVRATPAETPAAPLNNAAVIVAQGNNAGTETLDGQQTWLREFVGNPANIVVFVIVLAAVFFVCMLLFSRIFRYRSEAQSLEGKAKIVKSARSYDDADLARDNRRK